MRETGGKKPINWLLLAICALIIAAHPQSAAAKEQGSDADLA